MHVHSLAEVIRWLQSANRQVCIMYIVELLNRDKEKHVMFGAQKKPGAMVG